MNKIKSYIDGSTDKKKIDKTLQDWIRELFAIFFRAKKFIWIFLALYGGSFLVNYFPNWGISINPDIIASQRLVSFLVAPIIFVMVMILLVRLFGILFSFINPDIKVNDIKVYNDKIVIYYSGSKEEVFELKSIKRLIIAYNWRGFLLRTAEKTKTYSIQLKPKEIEQRLDVLKGLIKEVSSFESREGDIRTVYYTDPSSPDKKLYQN